MSYLLCASMNYANFDCLGEEIRLLDKAGVDIFHMDVCDGNLVPDFSLGLHDFQAVRRNTDKLVDVHLYAKTPMNLLDIFIDAGADILYVYAEAQPFITYPLLHIRERGKNPGLAIFSGSPVEPVEGYLPYVDYVLLNTKNPVSKEPSRQFMDTSWETIKKLQILKKQYGFKLIVDGALSDDIIIRAATEGVDGFVLGRCLFRSADSYEEKIKKYRNLI